MNKNDIIKKILSNSLFHLFFLFSLALSIRLYNARTGDVFVSGDEAYLFQYSLKPLHLFYNPSLEYFFTELFRFFNFPWGWGNIFLSTLNIVILSLLKIPITEFTITFPYTIIGSLTIVIAYLLGKELHGKRFGLIVGVLLTFLPYHVISSRTIIGNVISGLFFFFLCFFFFIKYFKTNKEKFKNIGYLFLGYYLITENQAAGIIIVLLVASFFFSEKRNIIQRFIESIKSLISLSGIFLALLSILPTFAAGLYLLLKGLGQQSFLNLTHSKPIALGFYILDTFKSIHASAGTPLFFLLLTGLLYYILLVCIKKQQKESTIFFLSFLFYSIPWLFIIIPYSAFVINGYHLYMIITLLFLAAYFVEDCFLCYKNIKTPTFKIVYSTLLLGIFSFIILYTSLVILSEIDIKEHGVPLTYIAANTQGKNNGIKTVGYYIRENTPTDTVLFADVELFVAEYYFGRTSIAAFDLKPEESLNLFSTVVESKKIDYIFISKENVPLFEEVIQQETFYPTVYAFQDDTIKGILYKKGETGAFKEVLYLDIEKYDRFFDEKYGNVLALFVDYE